MDWVIGGWQTNLIALLASGQPFDLSTGLTATGNEPDQIEPVKYPKGIRGYWFDPASFSVANIPTETVNGNQVYTRFGTARRNQLFGPGQRIVNFSMQKNIHVTDRYSLELHGDAFNVFNTPQFTNPGSTYNQSTFGKITSVQDNTNRQIQLAARFVF